MPVGEMIRRAAGAFDQKPGCGCAKRHAAMNAVIPGSGDAVKAAASTVARGLRGAARLIGGEPPFIGAPSIIGERPRQRPRRRSSGWTVPPEIPAGWRMADSCGSSALYINGGRLVVWDVADGQYRRFHGFSDGLLALKEFEQRCQR